RAVADRGGAVPARLPAAALDQRGPGGTAGLDHAGRARCLRRGPGHAGGGAVRRLRLQFMVEELAVGAQFNLPYIHVLVNNAYLGLIRQSQRGFDMDYCVQLSFDNVNAPELGGYGVDHVKVAEGLGCKAVRVTEPGEIGPAL